MAKRLINISCQALAVNVQMLGTLIKTMNLSSKENLFKLPTNCDTWVNNTIHTRHTLVKKIQSKT